ncbi:MAG: WD40 repeat domain-containing protein [Rhodanobacteraceae bacterium]
MYPSSVAWSPDGRYIATASTFSRSVHIWDVPQRKIVDKWRIPFGTSPWFHELAFSPDGKYLAACDGTGVLRIYRTGSWTTVHVFSELHVQGGCDHPVFRSDSQRIAAGLGTLTVISVPDWRIIKHLNLGIGWGAGIYSRPWRTCRTLTRCSWGEGSTSRLHFSGKNREAGTDAYGSLNRRIKHLAKPFESIVRLEFVAGLKCYRPDHQPGWPLLGHWSEDGCGDSIVGYSHY